MADENSFYGIDCARFGDSIDIILDREIFEHKSILKQYDEAVTLYRKYYQYDEIEGALRKTVELIPEKAFREAIANALVHRTWDVNSHIRIAMFKDRLEVFSPGGLPKGITQEEYLNGQVSVLRNPIVASVFFRLNIIESFGTGVRRMNMAYAESRAKPRHEFSTHAIKVVLPVVSGGEELSEDEAIIYNSMNRLGKSSSQIAKTVGFGKNKTLKLLVALEGSREILNLRGVYSMENLYEKAQQSAEYIQARITKRPKIAVVLGSGLGNLTADFTETEELPYRDIPNFPVSTVEGHKGALLAGKLGEKEVFALEGRFHFYEGYSMKEVCYPFYVLKLLGVEQVVLTNACGGINRSFEPGTLMLLTDLSTMDEILGFKLILKS